MGFRINTNVDALVAQRNLGMNSMAYSKSVERLSSGQRINRAADDSAGLAISEKLRGQTKGLNQAVRNAQDGISLIQTAEGALNETHSILQRMRELAVQANNSLNSASQFTALNNEFIALQSAITQIANGAKFAGTSLLTAALTLTLQIGSANTATQAFTLSTQAFTAAGLAVSANTITTTALANTAIIALDTAIDNVSSGRATLGASQQGLDAIKSALDVSVIANSEARSRIRDADIATEVSNLVKAQIQQQAGASALSAANFSSQFILQLLQ